MTTQRILKEKSAPRQNGIGGVTTTNYTHLIVKPDAISQTWTEHVRGVNKYSGKPFSRFTTREVESLSLRGGRPRLYIRNNHRTRNRRPGGIRDVTTSLVRNPAGFIAFAEVENYWGVTVENIVGTHYPLADYYHPMDGITPSLTAQNVQDFTLRLFGKTNYRKDLVKAVASLGRNQTPHLLFALSMKNRVPIDWIVGYLRTGVDDGGRFPPDLHLRGMKDLFRTASPRQLQTILKNGTTRSTLHHLRDTVLLHRILTTRGQEVVLADLQFRDIEELHGLLMTVKTKEPERPIKYKKGLAEIPGEYDGFTILAPRTTTDLVTWGRMMGNCIASYSNSAVSGGSGLYAVEKEGKMIANLELDPKGNVRQLLGRFNQSVDEQDRNDILLAVSSVFPESSAKNAWM